MEIIPDKSEVLHFGRTCFGVNYTVNGRTLRNFQVQRDLGTHFHSPLKVATQVAKVIKKAYDMLAFNSQGIQYKSWKIMLQLYKTLVRLYLEHCVHF